MAVPGFLYYRVQPRTSFQSGTRHDSGIGLLPDFLDEDHQPYNGVQTAKLPPQMTFADQNGLNVHAPSNIARVVAPWTRSLDEVPIMNNRERTSSFDSSMGSAIEIEDDEEDYPRPKAAISPLTILGAGRVDPFANYPVKMDITEYWLIDHGML
jgi:hypothetical protein